MGVRFRSDTRGVSEVVGAVLLLGILMLTLSIYQVAVVPNQNAATEFDHNQQVEDEMVDVRNAILEARSSGKDTFTSVTLGTRYQNRILTVNPPSPTGTLQTVQQPNINVTEEDGELRADPLGLSERPLENQFVEYSPRYYEYDQAGTIRFENTVAYHDYGDATIFLTNQTLLRGDTVTLVPLEGAFRKNGMQRVPVEPKPGVLETVQVDDPNVTVPTELTEEEWRELLGSELEPADSLSITDGNLTLSLDGTYDVAYAPIGINRVPTEGQRGGAGTEINPASPGDVSLTNISFVSSTDQFTLTFNNTGQSTANFTAARINFYFKGSGGTEPTNANIRAGGTDERLNVGDDFKTLEPVIQITNGTETDIIIDFNDGNVQNQDFFIITFRFETGETGLYFVGS